ncbi:MAG: phosphatidate cytidylyltransferase [Bacilli bacterium]|nr:phosphatidate cytidylyltransferase [Bacilli bacterium]
MEINEKNLSLTSNEDSTSSISMTSIKTAMETPSPEEEAQRNKRNSIMTRVITAIVLITFALPVVLLGDWFIFVFICVTLIGAIWEIIKCGRIRYSVFMYVVTLISSIFLMVMPLIRGLMTKTGGIRISEYFIDINFSPLIVFVVILFLFLAVIVDKNFTVREACFIFTMIFIIVFGLQSALYIRYIPSSVNHDIVTVASDTTAIIDNSDYFNVDDNFYTAFLLLWVCMSGVLSDTGGYIFGMLFGKTKMNERISPKKTWEGFFGGIVFSFALCTLVGLMLPAFTQGQVVLLRGVLDLEHWYNILILALILPPTSVIGDFVFSSIKRFNGIKDYGNIFPGHGGILDRIDSLIFSCMAAATYIFIWEFFVS